jgi:hypothetical protein
MRWRELRTPRPAHQTVASLQARLNSITDTLRDPRQRPSASSGCAASGRSATAAVPHAAAVNYQDGVAASPSGVAVGDLQGDDVERCGDRRRGPGPNFQTTTNPGVRTIVHVGLPNCGRRTWLWGGSVGLFPLFWAPRLAGYIKYLDRGPSIYAACRCSPKGGGHPSIFDVHTFMWKYEMEVKR